ncbi:MAG TPA: uroporphyrinogen-III synthase [Acidimicrobiia bacterium]|nr:uroporphyrinogen-III synthase [Acidimicrobiia bacterium]
MTRVAITTDRFDSVSSAYALRGLEPVPLSCLRVEPAGDEALTDAREAAADADLLVVTSPRTVSLLWPEQEMPEVEVAAVGESTAAAVAGSGGRVVAAGRAGLMGLIEIVADRLRGSRVVFPHAGGSDLAASQRLRELTGRLEEHVIYRTVPVAPAMTHVEAISFASPSAVQGWLVTRDLRDLVVGVIGTTTAAAVARIRPPDVVAARPSHKALALALTDYLEKTA